MQMRLSFSPLPECHKDLHSELRAFFDFNRVTKAEIRNHANLRISVYENEFWTAKQRDGHSLHEVSYRACYKPQLPGFFIERFCRAGDSVYDPFMGRGTTLVEAQLRGCRAIGNDANPLSLILVSPRLDVPSLGEIEKRLSLVSLSDAAIEDEGLLAFFEPNTLRELYAWRSYFSRRRSEGTFDRVDAWIQMVACNRLTGHSKGFFSVYTLPPNQATSIEAQRRINEKRGQQPQYRDTKALTLKKTKQLLRHSLPQTYNRGDSLLLASSADVTPQIPDCSVNLVVTSPPFLDTVDYTQDNWMRMWFCDLELPKGRLWQLRSLPQWVAKMTDTFRELRRVLRHEGLIAFEVGEVRSGALLLENDVVRAALEAGLVPECIMINSQDFTKTANCWGVSNNTKGTNTNRIVLLKKSA